MTQIDSVIPPRSTKVKHRNSNLELYRIVVMLFIIAHHFVVNSGLKQILDDSALNAASLTMVVFGAWGKTGIDCFVLITGYFMCKSKFSGKKLLKLYLQIIFYSYVIYMAFCLSGYCEFSLFDFARRIFPIYTITDSFSSCFLLFYLFIPFLNILIAHLDKRQHLMLVCIVLAIYTILPSIFLIYIQFNYVTWFAVLYIIAAWLRLYGADLNISHRTWGVLTVTNIAIAVASVASIYICRKLHFINTVEPYFFVADSNKLFAVLASICSFMWFKDVKMRYSPFINAVGASTFGILLIHGNSSTMHQWLWKDIVDCTGHFSGATLLTLGYATCAVICIFASCSLIDWLRGKYLEPYMMKAVIGCFNQLKCIFRPGATTD